MCQLENQLIKSGMFVVPEIKNMLGFQRPCVSSFVFGKRVDWLVDTGAKCCVIDRLLFNPVHFG